MVQRGNQSPTEAELELKGSLSSDKNEILYSRFGINYKNEPEVFRKGTVIYRDVSHSRASTNDSKTQLDKERKSRQKAEIITEHVDIIKDEFWEKRPWLLASKGSRKARP